MAARFLKSKKEAIGASPDAMIFTGAQKLEHPRINLIQFGAAGFEEMEISSIADIMLSESGLINSWLNIDGVHDSMFLKELAKYLGVEASLISKIQDTHARPRAVEIDGGLFANLKMVRYDEQNDEVITENLCLLLKEGMLISFQEQVGDVFEPIRLRIRNKRKRIIESGVDYLFFALLDVVIDNYIYATSILGEGIEALDEALIDEPHNTHLEEINSFKKEVNYLRKAIKPGREMVMSLTKLDVPFLSNKTREYFNELHHNVDLANESVDSYRDMLTDQLNIFHTNVSYRLNDILKFLTIFSVIFIPITFIAGIYGTNFDNIPELHYKYAYHTMWGAIILVVILMIVYFKRKRWF